MKVWQDVLAEIFRRKLDSIVGIVGLCLAVVFIPYLWLKVLLFLFIAFSLFNIWKGVRVLQSEKHIPLSVVVYGDEAERDSFIDDCLRQMDKWRFDEATFGQLGVDRDDWLISHPGDLPGDAAQWKRVVQEFGHKLNHVKAKLKGPEFFHVFLKCRTALAFGLGAAAGTWSNIVIYQEESGGQLKPVVYLDNKTDLPGHHSPHTVKDKVEPPYEFIRYTIPDSLTSPALVVLNLGAHSPQPYVETRAEERNLSCVIIDNTYNNTLIEKDWFKPAQEVASVLLQLLKRTTELEVYVCCPNALAFVIGMALGDQCPATIFHWFAEESAYKSVLKLNELR